MRLLAWFHMLVYGMFSGDSLPMQQLATLYRSSRYCNPRSQFCWYLSLLLFLCRNALRCIISNVTWFIYQALNAPDLQRTTSLVDCSQILHNRFAMS